MADGGVFVSTLRGEVLEKAERELNENPESRNDAIQTLRENILNRECTVL